MKHLLTVLFCLMLLAGCTAQPQPASPSATRTPGVLTPYPSATATPRPSPTSADTPTPLPSPTPTPRTHVLQQGQDLFGLSLYYNVPLADILALNPGINPNAMRVGSTIIIPPAAASGSPQPSATPAPLQLQPPDCWLAADGSALCLVLARNPLEVRLEAVSAVVRAQGGGGEVLSQNAYLPLDGIPAGAALPLAAYFAGPLQAPLAASAELVSAIPLNGADERHLAVELAPAPAVIAADGLSAAVSGTLSLPQGSDAASRAWVLAVAYNAQGRPLGLRRWEGAALSAGASVNYNFSVYSAGGAMARVEVFAEALP